MANGKPVTPLLSSKGFFEIERPFNVSDTEVFEVVAIRELEDLWNEHIDVYEEYYKDKGVSEERYNRDVKAGVSIVSLMGDTGVIHVPNTYIIRYPDVGLANYRHMVLSISLGAMHVTSDLSGLNKQLAEVCSQLLGIKPQIKIHVAPVTSSLTINEGKQLEKLRTGLKRVPNTEHLKYLKEKAEKDAIVQSVNKDLLKRFKKK